jgi:peptidoglycan/xylan/chitin deacetylase (PgdA/CDA1 family)
VSGIARLRRTAIRAGFEIMAASGLARMATPVFGGVGIMLTLHRVLRPRDDAFQPNRHLEIAPDFLRTLVRHLKSSGLDIVGIDEAARRLRQGEFERRFACLTFDDGYRDLRDIALPIMREFGAPLTAYVTADFASGISAPWWTVVEDIVAGSASIGPVAGVLDRRIFCIDAAAKTEAFAAIAGRLGRLGDPARIRQAVEDLAGEGGPSVTASAAKDCMSWDELRRFADDPLVTIGAHGISHCNLASASPAHAASEISGSRLVAETMIGRPIRHFAYPYGDRSAAGTREYDLVERAGFATGATTRPDVLSVDSGASPMALPRISINGGFQSERFLSVLTSGLATAAWNGLRRRRPEA